MRRFFYALLAACFVTSMVGCCSVTHGVCDCASDDDPCYTRAPWIHGSGHGAHGANGSTMPDANGSGSAPVTVPKKL